MNDVNPEENQVDIPKKKKKGKKEKVDYSEKELLAEQGDMGDIDLDQSSNESNMADVPSLSDDEETSSVEPLYVLPLYSLLPTSQQLKVFDSPPPGFSLFIFI